MLGLAIRIAIEAGAPSSAAGSRNYQGDVEALDPIAYYVLGEDSGSAALDYGPGGFHGTYIGAVPGGAAGIGDGNTAALFDGTDDSIDISAMAPAFSGAAGTVLVWGRRAPSTTGYLVRIAANGSNQVFIQDVTGTGTLTFRRQAAGASKSIADASLLGSTTFFSAAVTWDTSADQLKAYINGVQIGTTQTGLATFTGTPGATTTVIGAFNTTGTGSYPGGIAHVAIWDRALSPSEVLSLGVL